MIKIYDATGEGGKAEITFGFPLEEATDKDLLERDLSKLEVQGNSLKVKLGP